MNKTEFNEAQRLITKIEYVDSILEYKSFHSIMVIPESKSLADYKNPLEKLIVGEKKLQDFIRNSIEHYRVYLISELKELGVDYE